ncbi:TPA: excisionase family DNA-binding protein [Legionella pneumophila]
MSHVAIEMNNPSQQDRGIALNSFKKIKTIRLKSKKTAFLELDGVHVELPPSAVKLVVAILSEIAEGNALTLIPQHASLTTQQAADMLHVSRPYFIKLLESGEIPFQRVGNRRRVLAHDVTVFKENNLKQRKQALQELVDQAQKLDMGY